jgi:hypothetical protein
MNETHDNHIASFNVPILTNINYNVGDTNGVSHRVNFAMYFHCQKGVVVLGIYLCYCFF